jgi:hypothetical protein
MHDSIPVGINSFDKVINAGSEINGPASALHAW